MILATCVCAGCDTDTEAALYEGEDRFEELVTKSFEADEIDIVTTLAATPRPGDRDGDYVDDALDSCPDVEDFTNFDADLDGAGNACDADYDNDQIVGGSDYAVFIAAFGSVRGDALYDPRVDHDRSGSIGGSDFSTFLRYFNTQQPALAGTIPFANIAVGDRVYLRGTWTITTPDGIPGWGAYHTPTVVATSIERDAAGRVTSIETSGAHRIDVWSPDAFVVGPMFLPSSPNIGTLCSRFVLFPARPIDGISQLCTSFRFDTFTLTVSRS
ncbi:MAG: thrombospondin type 3 repeat-containing protein [Kofleriaceae bacterium]